MTTNSIRYSQTIEWNHCSCMKARLTFGGFVSCRAFEYRQDHDVYAITSEPVQIDHQSPKRFIFSSATRWCTWALGSICQVCVCSNATDGSVVDARRMDMTIGLSLVLCQHSCCWWEELQVNEGWQRNSARSGFDRVQHVDVCDHENHRLSRPSMEWDHPEM